MSGRIYPKVSALALGILRSLRSIVLILIAAACAYLSLAATEAPREVWWKFWTIYGVVGLCCLLGAGWLLRRSFSAIVPNVIAVVCVIIRIRVLNGPREYWWTLSILAIVGILCLRSNKPTGSNLVAPGCGDAITRSRIDLTLALQLARPSYLQPGG
jgi:hypothetical protein